MARKRPLVFVGLSGGVDSSVAAALLKGRGFDVVGVFIKIWQPEFTECTWPDDRRSAMRVATYLNIPFLTLDLSREYKREVLKYMVREYRRGRTPNPDVACNKNIKFGAFLRFAKEHGADYVATGHYARVKKRGSRYRLYAGVDREKDQSYFLWTLSQKELRHILFPIGEYRKSDVRRLARRYGLPTAERRDSQGLCFVGHLNLKEFLGHYIAPRSGDVLDEHDQVIGSHNGAESFTLGQRHGFSVTRPSTRTKPRFVTAVNVRKNTITTSTHPEESSASSRKLVLEGLHGTGGKPQGAFQARFRYRQPLMKVHVRGNSAIFEKPVLAAPGQSLVFYARNECVGGAVVKGAL